MDDHHHKALANAQRRELLGTLLQRATHHLDLRLDESVDRAVSFVHVHLPVLEDAGLIEWDRETHVVTRGPDFDVLYPLREDLQARVSP